MKNKLRKVQFKFLDYVFENMCSVKSKYYPDSTFFKKGDKVILELEKSGTLWVLYSVWSNISNMLSYEYNETQQLIKEWMEEQLKKEVIAPISAKSIHRNQMEEKLKKEEVAPSVGGKLYVSDLMEEQLKSGEIEPDCNFNTNIIRVQEELKSVEITPNWRIPVYEGEEELESVEVTPSIKGHSGSHWVESRLKLDEITPQRMNYVIIGGAGEELELEEVAPRSALPPYSWTNLKSEEVTPSQSMFLEMNSVQEEIKSGEITPEESIPLQSWLDLEKKEITPRNAIAPPFRWRKLDSEEVKPEKTTCFIDSVRWIKMNN